MAITPYREVRTADTDLGRIQDAVKASLRDISSRSILDGQILTGRSLLTGQSNVISHGLGRPLLGWILVGQDANAVVWASPSVTPGLTLVLQCSANCTVSLWVF